MDENKSAILALIENYFYHCEKYGHSDFDEWCDDNLENTEQTELFEKVAAAVATISEVLFD